MLNRPMRIPTRNHPCQSLRHPAAMGMPYLLHRELMRRRHSFALYLSANDLGQSLHRLYPRYWNLREI